MPNEQDRGALDFRAASDEILRYLHEQLPMARWLVARRSGSDLLVLDATGDGDGVGPGDRLRWDRSLAAAMVAGDGPRLAADVLDIAAYANSAATLGSPVRSFIGAPLVDDAGALFGVVFGVDPAPRPGWDAGALSLVELHAGLLSAVLSAERRAEQDRRRRERAAVSSMVDPLTGSSDRRGWEVLLGAEEDRCARYGEGAAVVVVDLDELDQVNQTYGRSAGDELLRLAHEVLAGCAGERGVVARLGGHQFGVLAAGLDRSEATLLRDRIDGALRADGVTASVGVAVRDRVTPTLAQTWSAAGRSMLEVKRDHLGAAITRRSGGLARSARRQVIDVEPRPALRVVTPDSLLGALDDAEFRLYLQPVVDLVDGAVRGAEALLRWQHPTRGLLSPAEFLAVAEAAGVIRPIGDWVIAEACRLGRRCVDEGHDVSFSISANVSVSQLDDASFAERVIDRLSQFGLEPHRLHIEVTETMPMGDSSAVGSNLAQLRAAGVLVALDDFGTRYATLETLLRCPLDVVKLDQVFVQQIDTDPFARQLVSAVVALCADGGLGVVAEGVETEAQAAVLRDLGCPQAQGFHFGRPTPADEFLVASLV